MAPIYDIFRGANDRQAMWLEAVESLDIAEERIKKLAIAEPGPYFVFCTTTHRIIASIDTSLADEAKGKKSA